MDYRCDKMKVQFFFGPLDGQIREIEVCSFYCARVEGPRPKISFPDKPLLQDIAVEKTIYYSIVRWYVGEQRYYIGICQGHSEQEVFERLLLSCAR